MKRRHENRAGVSAANDIWPWLIERPGRSATWEDIYLQFASKVNLEACRAHGNYSAASRMAVLKNVVRSRQATYRASKQIFCVNDNTVTALPKKIVSSARRNEIIMSLPLLSEQLRRFWPDTKSGKHACKEWVRRAIKKGIIVRSKEGIISAKAHSDSRQRANGCSLPTGGGCEPAPVQDAGGLRQVGHSVE